MFSEFKYRNAVIITDPATPQAVIQARLSDFLHRYNIYALTDWLLATSANCPSWSKFVTLLQDFFYPFSSLFVSS